MKLDEAPVHVRLKLSGLWASVMFCYVYGDFFGLFRPGKLSSMLAAQTPLGPTTQGILLGFSIVMAIPSLMVFLSLVLRPGVSRWANIVFGVCYTGIMLAAMTGGWSFYVFLGCIEVALTALIVWYAWTWPQLI